MKFAEYGLCLAGTEGLMCLSWLGWRDSNPRMLGPEPSALPLGDTLSMPKISILIFNEGFDSPLASPELSDYKQVYNLKDSLATRRLAGFTPNAGTVDLRCLTTWRRPNNCAICRNTNKILTEFY